jgi:hypothetical protein
MGARLRLIGILLPLAALLALPGCSSGPFKDLQNPFKDMQSPFGKSKAQVLLEDGIRDYEEGQYKSSARKLKAAIDEGLRPSDRITAHKYLAFINCVSNREIQCREEFRSALAIDPRFELTPAEAGHPIWGPVFRNMKASR